MFFEEIAQQDFPLLVLEREKRFCQAVKSLLCALGCQLHLNLTQLTVDCRVPAVQVLSYAEKKQPWEMQVMEGLSLVWRLHS